jgi:hypothetical protein
MTVRSSVQLFLSMYVLALAMLGCDFRIGADPGITDGIEAINRTDETLQLVVLAAGEEHALPAELPPGQGKLVISGSMLGPDSLVMREGCTVGDLVARGPDGHEVARHEGPLCIGDVWIVEEPPISS